MGKSPQKRKSLEEELSRLEELAEQMKNETLPIEEAICIFEEGLALSKKLEDKLTNLELKIKVLLNDPNDNTAPKFGNFDN